MKGGKYYSRITWRVSGKKNEIVIPLKTSSLTTARTRLKSINNEQGDIINGIIQKHQFNDIFRWLNPEGTSRFTSLKLVDVIPEYLKYRKCVVRKGTAERDKYAIQQLSRYLGNKAVQDITYKDIEEGFIPHLKKQGRTDSGINISLRHLKIFFNWMYDKEKVIAEPIKFKMVKEGKLLPRYINRQEIDAVSDAVDEFFQRCFYFYENTGCRPKEPFMGEIDGNWLRISPEETKGRNWRMIQLTDELKYILMEMRDMRDRYIAEGRTYENAIHRCYEILRTKLNRTINQLGLGKDKRLTLKSYRHQYGIKRVHQTGDIFRVSREMGHTQVTTTQKYLEFPQDMILEDFPELVVNMPNFQGELHPHSDNALSPLPTPVLGDGGNLLVETHRFKGVKS